MLWGVKILAYLFTVAILGLDAMAVALSVAWNTNTSIINKYAK